MNEQVVTMSQLVPVLGRWWWLWCRLPQKSMLKGGKLNVIEWIIYYVI